MNAKQEFRSAYSHARWRIRYDNAYRRPRPDSGIDDIAHSCVVCGRNEWPTAWEISLSGKSIGYVARAKQAGHIIPGHYPLNILPLP